MWISKYGYIRILQVNEEVSKVDACYCGTFLD